MFIFCCCASESWEKPETSDSRSSSSSFSSSSSTSRSSARSSASFTSSSSEIFFGLLLSSPAVAARAAMVVEVIPEVVPEVIEVLLFSILIFNPPSPLPLSSGRSCSFPSGFGAGVLIVKPVKLCGRKARMFSCDSLRLWPEIPPVLLLFNCPFPDKSLSLSPQRLSRSFSPGMYGSSASLYCDEATDVSDPLSFEREGVPPKPKNEFLSGSSCAFTAASKCSSCKYCENFDRFTSSALSPLPKLHAPGVVTVCNNSKIRTNSGRSQDSRDQQSKSNSSISVSTQLGIFGR